LEKSIFEHLQDPTKNNRIREDLLAGVAKELILALKEMHSCGFIHRDIKPDNIRVHKGKIYLTDFGTILRALDDDG
jgi:serine/threonine protein kinase